MTWALANSFSSYSSLSWPLMRTLLGCAWACQRHGHIVVNGSGSTTHLHQDRDQLLRICIGHCGNAAQPVLPEHPPDTVSATVWSVMRKQSLTPSCS